MEHGWLHCTTLHISDRHAKRTTTTKSRRQPVFRTLQRRKEHCATTTGSDTTAFNGMEPTPYSWVNIQTTEVLQLPVEKGAPERYCSALLNDIEPGAKELLKRAPQKEYLRWNFSEGKSTWGEIYQGTRRRICNKQSVRRVTRRFRHNTMRNLWANFARRADQTTLRVHFWKRREAPATSGRVDRLSENGRLPLA